MGRKRALVFALMLVTSSIGGLAAGPGAVAAQDDGEAQVNTCSDPMSRSFGAVVGAVTAGSWGGASTAANPCIKSENIADADTVAEAKRVIAQEALEDRRYFESYLTQFATYNNQLKNPAYSDARIAFVDAVANGTDRVSAVTEARRAAHARTSNQQRELWVYYASMADSIAALENKAEDKGVRNSSLEIGHRNSSGDFVTGYSFQTGATTNITVTNGSEVSVPVAVSDSGNDTINPLTDGLLVQVYNPETKRDVNIVNSGTMEPETLAYDIDTDTIAGGTVKATTGNTLHLDRDGDGTKDSAVRLRNGDIQYLEGAPGDPWNVQNSVSYTGDSYPVNYTFEQTSGSLVIDTEQSSKLTVPRSANVSLVDSMGGVTEYRKVTGDYLLTGYTNDFRAKHNALAGIDDDVVAGLGNSTSGYLSDVYDQYQSGSINLSEVLTGYDKVELTPEDLQDTATLNWMYSQLGMGRPGEGARVDVTIQAGSVVDGQTIDSDRSFTGATIWATDAPANNTWQAGEAYDVSNLGQLGVTYAASDSYWRDGELITEESSRMLSVTNGSIVIDAMRDDSGQSRTTVRHVDRDPSQTNVSRINQQLDQLEAANERLRAQLMNTSRGGSPGSIDVDFGGVGNVLPSGNWLPDMSFGVPGIGNVPVVLLAGGGLLALVVVPVGITLVVSGVGPLLAVLRIITGGR